MPFHVSRRYLVALLAVATVGCSAALFAGGGSAASEVAASSAGVGQVTVAASTGLPTLAAATPVVTAEATTAATPLPENTPTVTITVVVVTMAPATIGVADAQPAPALVPPEHIRIAAIGLDADVVTLGWSVQETENGPVSVWDDLPANEAAWLRNSAMPGQNSNVVITGHHNVGAEVFRDLVLLEEGDEIVLTAGGKDYTYVVSERVIVPERDVPKEQRLRNGAWMKTATCERLTLVTCWPYETNTHRLILVADPVSASP